MATNWPTTTGGRRPCEAMARRLLGVAVVGLFLAGCGKPAPSTGTGTPPPSGPGPGNGPAPSAGGDVLSKLPGGDEFAAGKKVYADNNCARCHKLGDTGGGGGPMGAKGGPGGMNGPDLTAVGADAAHTARWLADHVRDPKAHKPQSRMPASGPDKIADADLTALSAYLASRK